MPETKGQPAKATTAVGKTSKPVYLCDFLGRAVNTKKFADVIFVVGEGKKQVEFYGHRQVLAGASPLFEAMLYPTAGQKQPTRHNPVRVTITDTEPDHFLCLLQCIYADEVKVTQANLLPLITIAKKYRIETLQALCFDHMQGDVSTENALDMYQVAPELLGDDSFGLSFICENAAAVFESKAFTTLPADRLAHIIKSDDLALNEAQVLESLLTWGRAQLAEQKKEDNTANLKEVLAPLLMHVRFPSMSMQELSTVVASSGLLTEDEMLMLFSWVAGSADDEGESDSEEDDSDDESDEEGEEKKVSLRKQLRRKMPWSTQSRVGSLFDTSKLITGKYADEIVKLFAKQGKAHMELLYRGSRDGFNGSAFHQKCDKAKSTFTIIRSNHGNIFGGYTSSSWGQGTAYCDTGKTFLFSLKNKHNKTIKLLPSGGNHMYCNPSYGPTFGGGHDLSLNADFSSNGNYCNPNSYKKFAPGFPNVTYDNTTLSGAYNFMVNEVEVFSVVLKK